MYTNEVQIQINDALGCPGRCPGCVLSDQERKGFLPSMSRGTFDNIIKAVKSHLQRHGKEKVCVTFGIADHFVLPEDWLHYIVRETANLMTSLAISKPTIAISCSLVSKTSILEAKMERLSELIRDFPNIRVIPLVVLDPILLDNPSFSDAYSKNLEVAKRLSGQINLSMNLSLPAIEKMPTTRFKSLIEDHGFDEIVLNWTPTFNNLTHTYGDGKSDLKSITEWVMDFDSIFETSSGKIKGVFSTVARGISSMIEDTLSKGGDADVFSIATQSLADTIYHSLQFDENGEVFPTLEAVGDIPFGPRFGVPSYGNVNTPDFDFEAVLEQGIERTIVNALRVSCMSPCNGCEFTSSCIASGYFAYNLVLPDCGTDECRSPAFSLFSKLARSSG